MLTWSATHGPLYSPACVFTQTLPGKQIGDYLIADSLTRHAMLTKWLTKQSHSLFTLLSPQSWKRQLARWLQWMLTSWTGKVVECNINTFLLCLNPWKLSSELHQDKRIDKSQNP